MKATRQATHAMAECVEDADCYVRLFAAAAERVPDGVWLGIKAAHRVAQLGQPRNALELARAMNGDRDPGLMWVAAHAIDHLLPYASQPVEDELWLQFITGDGHSHSGDAPALEHTLHRLCLRAADPTPAPEIHPKTNP